jgi:hypothetical protein
MNAPFIVRVGCSQDLDPADEQRVKDAVIDKVLLLNWVLSCGHFVLFWVLKKPQTPNKT